MVISIWEILEKYLTENMEHGAYDFQGIIAKHFTKTINSNGKYRELESVAGIFVARIG